MRSEDAGAAVGVGTVIDETYEVVGLLGRGGMGAVWLARHRRVPKKVAIKVLNQSAAGDPQALARFRREAEIASRIGHPGIVEVLDFAMLPSGEPYLVLEHLEGESLAARLARAPLPVEDGLDVARQLGSALAAAHRQGVVHRDLKPENVFLVLRDRDGRLRADVKVLDFGISKIQGSQTLRTQEAVLVGTPQYMAPEQATGKNDQVDARSDQFALAAIVYEMVAGRPPWVAGSLAETLFQVVYEPTPPLDVPGLPARARAAIERGLAKVPAERFPDVGAFVEALTGTALVSVEREPVVSDPGADALGETLDSGQGRPALAAELPRVAPVAGPASGADRLGETLPLAGAVVGPAPLPRAVTPAPSPRPDTPVPEPYVSWKERTGRAPKWFIFGTLIAAGVLGAVLALTLRPGATTPPTLATTVGPSGDAARGLPPDATRSAAGLPDAATAVSAGPNPDAAAASRPPRKLRLDAAPLTIDPPGDSPDDDEPAPVGEHADVTAARAHLREGHLDEARRLATRALRNGAGLGARRVLVQIECAAKDLTRARAWLQAIPARLRPRLVLRCRALGLELR